MISSKSAEIAKIEERNIRMREIMTELGDTSDVWTPTLADSEIPESVLTVSESQITATKFVDTKLDASNSISRQNGVDTYERYIYIPHKHTHTPPPHTHTHMRGGVCMYAYIIHLNIIQGH